MHDGIGSWGLWKRGQLVDIVILSHCTCGRDLGLVGR